MTDSSSVELGTFRGIHVRVSRAWAFIFLVVTLLLAERAASEFPAWTPGKRYSWGLCASLLFFLSVLIHELSRGLVAQANGIQVHSVTLQPFGGLARFAREALKPIEEFWIALTGPLVSLMTGAILLILAFMTETQLKSFSFMLREIGAINILLGVFNLLPGFPLDGGRVLRSAIWWFTGDFRKATYVATRFGQGVAGLFLFVGIFLLLEKRGLGLLWVLFGLYLFGAAWNGYRQAELRERLRAIHIQDVGWDELPFVPADQTATEFLDIHDFGARNRLFLVLNGEVIAGIITMELLRLLRSTLEEKDLQTVRLRDYMLPIERFERISPETDVVVALEQMEFANVPCLPVVKDNELQGFVSREAILEIIRQQFEDEL